MAKKKLHEEESRLGLCECADLGCSTHTGISNCNAKMVDVFYRVDMFDETGVAFCEPCGEDALESGLFRDEA